MARKNTAAIISCSAVMYVPFKKVIFVVIADIVYEFY
jgi:hypothetical protein